MYEKATFGTNMGDSEIGKLKVNMKPPSTEKP